MWYLATEVYKITKHKLLFGFILLTFLILPSNAEITIGDGKTYTFVLDDYFFERENKELLDPLHVFNCETDIYTDLCVPSGEEFTVETSYHEYFDLMLEIAHEDSKINLVNAVHDDPFVWVMDTDWDAYREWFEMDQELYKEYNGNVPFTYELIETETQIGTKYEFNPDDPLGMIVKKYFFRELVYDKTTGLIVKLDYQSYITEPGYMRTEVAMFHLEKDNDNRRIPGFEFIFLGVLIIPYILRKRYD